MMVDEWGTWYEVEPGTNPGFLYQQNTMRDALVAAINLNIFNKHCDRVKMACLAQIVNVLQSVLLTEGEQMIKTPTWHVFRMFREHQDAQLLNSHIETETIGEEEQYMVPSLSESASIDQDGKLQITIGNLSAHKDYPVDTHIAGFAAKKASAQILTGQMRDMNTFDEPDTVMTREYEVKLQDGVLSFTVPAHSVIKITVEQ